MKTQLFTGDYGTFELTPVSKKHQARLERETGENTVLFQNDWDFPGLARNLGWNMKCGKHCRHSGTDGTVDCPDCGLKAGDFIQAAIEWLRENDGRVFVGKGEEYFNL